MINKTEAWTLLNPDAAALRVFQRKVLRKIFGPVRVGDDFHILSNNELYVLPNDIVVVQRINIHQLLWLSQVVRMEEDALARRRSAEVGEEDDLISVGRTKSRKPCHRLV